MINCENAHLHFLNIERYGVDSDIVIIRIISFPWSQSDHIKRLPLYIHLALKIKLGLINGVQFDHINAKITFTMITLYSPLENLVFLFATLQRQLKMSLPVWSSHQKTITKTSTKV